MKRLFSLLAATAFGIVGTQAPVASAASRACPSFGVPVGSSPNCSLSSGVGSAHAQVLTNAAKTEWLLQAILSAGSKASLFLLDKDGNNVRNCVSVDTSPDGVGPTHSQCTTPANLPKTGLLILVV